MGANSLPKTVTRQRRGCDLNPGPSAAESSTLTTRLPSHPQLKCLRISRCNCSRCVWMTDRQKLKDDASICPHSSTRAVPRISAHTTTRHYLLEGKGKNVKNPLCSALPPCFLRVPSPSYIFPPFPRSPYPTTVPNKPSCISRGSCRYSEFSECRSVDVRPSR